MSDSVDAKNITQNSEGWSWIRQRKVPSDSSAQEEVQADEGKHQKSFSDSNQMDDSDKTDMTQI